MNIRAATVADIAALMRIAGESVSAGHWTETQYESALTSEHPKRVTLLLEDSGAVLGFAVAAEVAGEWELENIAVATTGQRRGYGHKLLGALLAEISERGAEMIHLEVRESNLAARGLYERWGFGETGRRPGYYHSPPEDAILYKKILSQQLPKSVDRPLPRV
jgi:ribosomal-protein-alanine acetyltransferase